uniref:(northern house mosquito) hypothetical protein n=1 Tax=Culex pipiens TaxID=7175 RepID=A0A8D8J620_CULPI
MCMCVCDTLIRKKRTNPKLVGIKWYQQLDAFPSIICNLKVNSLRFHDGPNPLHVCRKPCVHGDRLRCAGTSRTVRRQPNDNGNLDVSVGERSLDRITVPVQARIAGAEVVFGTQLLVVGEATQLEELPAVLVVLGEARPDADDSCHTPRFRCIALKSEIVTAPRS